MGAGQTSRQQVARTAVKSGPRPVATPGQPVPTGTAATQRRSKASAGKSPRARAGAARPATPGHRREIVALAMLGVAVFLFVVLLSGGAGGVLGRGSAAGLTFAFGQLALVVPLVLILVAATTVFDVRLWRSYWFIGGLVFLFGLFLLVAAGAPPFGGHSAGYFASAEFEGRAGGLGEAVYAALHGLTGTAGVAIIGWLTVVAGFCVATGMTVARMTSGTKRAAGAVRDTAERGMTVARGRGEERLEDPGLALFATGSAVERKWGAPPGGTTPQLGPIDLVGDEGAAGQSGRAEERSASPFGEEFDDWSDGHTAARSPLAPVSGTAESGGVLDGARAFSDLYGSSAAEAAGRDGQMRGPASAPEGTVAGLPGAAGRAVAGSAAAAGVAARARAGPDRPLR